MDYPEPIARLIEELRRLPGLGPKSAQRVAFFLLKAPADSNRRLAEAIESLAKSVGLCQRCNAFTDLPVCSTCTDPSRIDSMVCVVEEPGNIMAVDRTGGYRGRYHVLHGALSPIQGLLLDLVLDGTRDPARVELLGLLIARNVLPFSAAISGLEYEVFGRLSDACARAAPDAGDAL